MATFPSYGIDYTKINANALIPPVKLVDPTTLDSEINNFDCLVLLTRGRSSVQALPLSEKIKTELDNFFNLDMSLDPNGHWTRILPVQGAPGNRVILSNLGPVHRFVDDVRRYYDAAETGINKAFKAGSRKPLLVADIVKSEDNRYQHALEVSVAGSLSSIWEPLEAREFNPDVKPFLVLGVVAEKQAVTQNSLDEIRAIELGKFFARDITGTEPERMAPAKLAELCEIEFKGTDVKLSIMADYNEIDKQYPLLAAVARASNQVERHRPRVIRLEYTPSGPVDRTLLIVGKGLTYDTGGADLKVGGHMAGMSRDKGGAGSAAGFLRTIAELKPQSTKVVAYLGVVRNSIGEEAFLTDEIITSRGGKRVRIGNTDAEGRLVMTDLLAKAKEDAQSETNPILFTIATLTGHAYRAYGPYPIAMPNGMATSNGYVTKMQNEGELWAEPFAYSVIRREDYDFVAPKSGAEDIISCNSAPSTMTARGHMFPFAFLDISSGLIDHDLGSEHPLPYVHLDIGGSGVTDGDWQFGRPTGSTIMTMTKTFLK